MVVDSGMVGTDCVTARVAYSRVMLAMVWVW